MRFLLLLNFFITISKKTSLLIDNPRTTAVDVVISIKPNSLTDNVKKLDVLATKTSVSNQFKFVVNKFCFFYFTFNLHILSLKKIFISSITKVETMKSRTSFIRKARVDLQPSTFF